MAVVEKDAGGFLAFALPDGRRTREFNHQVAAIWKSNEDYQVSQPSTAAGRQPLRTKRIVDGLIPSRQIDKREITQ